MRSSSSAGSRKSPSAGNQTKECQCHPGGGPGRLSIIGLGPGHLSGLSQEAREALDRAEVIVGYKIYVEQVKDLLAGKEIAASGMTRELERAGLGLDLALAGREVALVSGGDPGIYAMAGVVFELARARGLAFGTGPGQVRVEVIPGIPALAAAAALLGAPLTHDFACISLSDRLTPWTLIEKRLALAAEADFVLVLYNPKSKGRDWQFGRACEIVAEHRPGQTPVGIVTRARREGQEVSLTHLDQAASAAVDMQTVVIIGNSQSFVYQDRLVTPRGYIDKYGSDDQYGPSHKLTRAHPKIILWPNLIVGLGLNMQASAFLAACCGVSEQFNKWFFSTHEEDSPQLAAGSFNSSKQITIPRDSNLRPP